MTRRIDDEIIEATDELKVDVELTHEIVHGDENTVVETEGGGVPSHAKVAKDTSTTIVAMLEPSVSDINEHTAFVTEKADEAAVSASNAESSASSASASENNASSSETAAANSATAAATSESNASDSEEAAASSASSAGTSASNAATSESNAADSASEAATSEGNASSSETAAANSATAAATSESNASDSEEAAASSASSAGTSASNAATSESNAADSASAAAASEAAAKVSEDNASESESNANQSSVDSELSAAASAASATESLQYAEASETSAHIANDSEAAALASEQKAQKWAEEEEDVPVEGDQFSSKHWAAKAEQFAGTVTNGMYFAGSWDMADGLPPTPVDDKAPWYRVVASVAEALLPNLEQSSKNPQWAELVIDANPGDQLCWDPINLEWFLIDTTDQVWSVNGQLGDVNLDADDVGALPIAGGTLNGHLTMNLGDYIYLKNGVHVISHNDGGGNFNIRLNSTASGESTYVVSESAIQQEFSYENDYPFVYLKMAGPGTAGERITWDTIIRFTLDNIKINENIVYHQGFKPTASDIGAVSTSGGSTISSDQADLLIVNRTNGNQSAAVKYQNNDSQVFAGIGSDNTFVISNVADLTTGGVRLNSDSGYIQTPGSISIGSQYRISSTIIIQNINNNYEFGNTANPSVIRSSVNPTFYNGSSTQTFYHTGNKPSVTDIGAAPAADVDTLQEEMLVVQQEVSTAQADIDDHKAADNPHGIVVPPPGRVNLLINGDFRIWQRGDSHVVSDTRYTADRWRAGSYGTVTVNNGDSSANISADQGFNILQFIESPNISKSLVNVSFDITWSVATTDLQIEIYWVSDDLITVGKVINNPVASSHGHQSFAMEVPEKVETATHLTFNFHLPESEAAALTITNIQLSEGSQEYPFERTHIAEELALCQRYFFRDHTAPIYINLLLLPVGETMQEQYKFPVTMRNTPAVVFNGENSGGIVVLHSISNHRLYFSKTSDYPGNNNNFIVYAFSADAEI